MGIWFWIGMGLMAIICIGLVLLAPVAFIVGAAPVIKSARETEAKG
jgi:hypothetical protein